MLRIACTAWLGVVRAARFTPATIGTCAGVLVAVSVLTWRGPWPAYAALCLAVVCVQAVLAKLVLRHLTVGDDGGLAAWRPDKALLHVGGAILLTQIMAAAPLAAMLAVLLPLSDEIGPLSTLLTIPLMLPLVLLAAACALRLSLAALPAALRLSAPLADSWAITDGHTLFLAGAWIAGVGPVIAALLELRLADWLAWWAQAGLFGVAWMALAAAQAGLTVGLYQRWQTGLRPDMRPSRNPLRRHEPLLGG